MMRRTLIFLLLLLFALLLVSCGGESVPTTVPSPAASTTAEPVTTTAATTVTTTEPRADLAIPYAELADYTLVVKNGHEGSEELSAYLLSEIGKRAGCAPTASDRVLGSTERQIAVISPELIGMSPLRYHNYDILYRDNTVYILAGSEEAEEAAITAFLSLFHGGALNVPGNGRSYSHPYEYSEILLNGWELWEYALFAEGDARPYMEELRDAVLEKSGILLSLTDTPQEACISLTVSTDRAGLTTVITADEGRITICGSEKNGMYYGVRAFLDLMKASAVNGSVDMKIENEMRLSSIPHAAPSAAAFYDENGELDINGDGKIHIAFIGGSLTENNKVWCPPVVDYFKQRFPNKTVTYTNAAIGATNSTMGAVRFAHDVLSREVPDIVFVEYAVNDAGFATESDYSLKYNGVYVESIIRQCLSHEHRPAVVLLNFPRGFTPEDTLCRNWKNGVALKERIAAHYGVATVNVFDYMQGLYATQKAENNALTYADFLLQYYSTSDYVHPQAAGYAAFGDAILAALDANFEDFLTNRQDAEIYLSDYRREILTTWELLPMDAFEVTIEGDGVLHTQTPGYPGSDPNHIPPNSFTYPRFVDGVWQIEDGAKFTITLETNANVIGIYGIHSPEGMAVDVRNADTRTYIKTVDTRENHTRPLLEIFHASDYNEWYYYTLTPSSDTTGRSVFRMGYFIVGYYPD